MIKVFKWLWDKAQNHGEQKVLNILYGLRTYHIQKAELMYYKNKYEPEKFDDNDIRKFMSPRLSPKEHSAIANELGRLLTDFEKQKELKHD